MLVAASRPCTHQLLVSLQNGYIRYLIYVLGDFLIRLVVMVFLYGSSHTDDRCVMRDDECNDELRLVNWK